LGIQFAQISVVGTLGRDAELGYTPNGSVNLKFSVATEAGSGDKKHTNWFNVTLWGKSAETMQEYLVKGKQVAVAGRFDIRDYTDKEGKSRYSLEISADNVQLVGSRSDGDGANVGNAAAPAKAARKPKAVEDDFAFAEETDGTDDVPF
jgi:single-strand DNA-binding protein